MNEPAGLASAVQTSAQGGGAADSPAPTLRATPFSDRTFLLLAGGVYVLLVVALTLTLSPYFSLGWDVTTFIAAGWSVLGGQGRNPLALYQVSREAFYWPYAYPPLHAMLVAPFLALRGLLPGLPESVAARLPVVLFDVALAAFLACRVWAATARRDLSRLACLVWLFNPVTLYHTAVQAHFESEWVLLVLLAYATVRPGPAPGAEGESRPGGPWLTRPVGVAAGLLAAAILIKQVAVIYAVPYGLYLWLHGQRRQAVTAAAITSALVTAV
jgi:hypothetical protein